MTAKSRSQPVAKILTTESGGVRMTLDTLRDPQSGAWLAPARSDAGPVRGLADGQSSPLIAIVDTGLDPTHPWIAATLVDSIDLTGQGQLDRCGHGTWVAVLLLGGAPPPIGLLDVKAIGDDGTGSPDALARGIRWAARRGAEIVVVSAGVDQPSCNGDCPVCAAALAAARDGALVFAAAGNTAGTTVCPARAGLLHAGAGVVAGGVLDWNTGKPQSYSGIATSYLFSPAPVLQIITPDGHSPQDHSAAASAALQIAINTAFLGAFDDVADKMFASLVHQGGPDAEPELRGYAVLALVSQGMVHRDRGDALAALARYTEAIERFDNDPADVVREHVLSAYRLRAVLRDGIGDDAAALADYQTIIGRSSSSRVYAKWAAWAHHRGGFALQRVGREAEAETAFRDAERLYLPAAEAGDPSAMWNMAKLPGIDVSTKWTWVERAARAGNMDAMYYYGRRHEANNDFAEAQQWYHRAADAGHLEAMVDLSVQLADCDPETSTAWRRKALATDASKANQLFHSAAPPNN